MSETTALPKEIERKYLIQKPDLEVLKQIVGCEATEITQTYLIQNNDFNRRIRKRGFGNHWEYTYTQKKRIAFGEHIELEDVISKTEYQALLQEADPKRKAIHKIRCCIPYHEQLLEIDIYAFSEKYATLEIELPSIETPVFLPEWLYILEDVTGKKGYSNFELSQAQAFPEELA